MLCLPAWANGWVDLDELLRSLYAAGVRRVMVEGGAKVLTSFLRASLVDYAVVTVAPVLLGGLSAVGALERGHLPRLRDVRQPPAGRRLGAGGRAPLGRGVKRRALVFTAPGQVEVIEEELPPPGPGQLLVRTRVSAISAGTELLAYRGQLPADLALDETLPALAGGSFRYPFRYGYASVGEVAEVGAGVGGDWRGRRVFSFQPHASAFVVGVEPTCSPCPTA